MYTIANWMAYVVCPFCLIVASAVGSARRYLGYCQPVRGGLNRNEKEPGGAWHWEKQVLMDGGEQQQQARLSSAEMRGLADAAGECVLDGMERQNIGAALRFTGRSPLLQLPYIDAMSFMVVPFAHAFLYGVMKDLVGAILGPQPKQGQVR